MNKSPDEQRYLDACHAMQTGVAVMMNYRPSETDPKHLRVGVNSAMVGNAALVRLLSAKGVFTLDEYYKELADEMEREAGRYSDEVNSSVAKNTDTNPDIILK
jgi:hypothetical protein